MSVSLFRLSEELYSSLKDFKEDTAATTRFIETYNPEDLDENLQRALPDENIALVAYDRGTDDFIGVFETAINHVHFHPDINPLVAPIFRDVKENLDKIHKAMLADTKEELRSALTNRKDIPLDEARKARLEKLMKSWKRQLLALPCMQFSMHGMHKDPYSESKLERPLEFTYTQLPTSTSIRLVEMRTDFEYDCDAISITLHTVDLEDKPTYAALSYTWGKPALVYTTREERDKSYDAKITIVCNGQQVQIGENLYYYMRQWRRTLQNNEPTHNNLFLPPTYLWIDALCINQESNEEKNKQVAMMGRVYQQCTKVVVWLGVWDAFSESANRLLSDIVHLNGKTGLNYRPYKSLSIEEQCEKLDLPDKRSWFWICLWSFFNRAWFRRAWVVQEMALAPAIQVQSGHVSYNWAALTETIRFFQATGLKNHIEDAAYQEMSGPAAVLTHFNEQGRPEYEEKEREEENRRLHFLDGYGLAPLELFVDYLEAARSNGTIALSKWIGLLRLGSHFECVDPRDKVYAFLSLAQRDGGGRRIEDSNIKPLEVRYQDSVPTVYLQAAWHVLLCDRHLELLSEAALWGGEEQEEGGNWDMPSWAPDWSSVTMRIKGSNLQSRNYNTDINWHACNNLPWEAPDETHLYQRYLSISGLFIDTICEVAERSADLSCAVEVALGLPEQYQWTSRSENPIEVLKRTMLENHWYGEMPMPQDVLVSFDVLLRRAFSKEICPACKGAKCKQRYVSEEIRSRMHALYPEFKHFLSPESGEKTCEYLAGDTSAHLDKMIFGGRWTSHVRKVFRTERGYLGTGLLRVRPGDKVYVVAGSPVPFILRQAPHGQQNDFTFICDSYVHGVMYGEALSDISKETMKSMRIV